MRALFLLLLGIVCLGPVYAQQLPAVGRGISALRHSKSVLNRLNQEAPLILGNYRIGFSSVPTKNYAPYLQERFFGNTLDYSAYPKTARHNDARILKELHKFTENAVRLAANFPRVTSQIQTQIFSGPIPYGQFLPQDIDVLYIGEIHNETRVQDEIVSLVRQLPGIYPGRNIYLAAEVIPTRVDLPVEKNLILTLDDLAQRMDIAAPLQSIRVVTAALDVQIPLYGLEDEMAILVASTPPKRNWPTDEQFDSYAVSLEGMDLRNRIFARKIRELQFFDPGALIVVYGGIDHMAYHNSSALPSLIKGKSFVVQVTVPSFLGVSNPLFASFSADETLRQKFHASPNNKLVESWKAPTSFNQMLGNDLTVIVHE